MNYDADYIAKLQAELIRVCCRGNKFTLDNGDAIDGATESETIAHLTSSRDYCTGRQTRFPGIGNGWNVESAINAAGFKVITAKNRRNQTCRIVTL